MSDLALRVDHLSKSYRIAHAQDGQKIGRYKTLQEDLLALPRSLWAAVRGRNGAGHETIWALEDISFEITQGEVVGIIGRNGAGKSTLLKVLSRITEPTKGRAEVYGRIGSLLEVGTGFHPELTGRENIFLNGAVLGMRRKEIARKFDEIVAFAEVEKFIDTPVKFYSSGMYVRLAFAVAAHLEPEILLVDEVLAVGDIAFQKKCLGKMGEVATEGRTVLLVSHNMGAIRTLCRNTIWLDNGHLVKLAIADEVVRIYEDQAMDIHASISSIVERRLEDVTDPSFYVSRVEMMSNKGEHTIIFRYSETLALVLDIVGYPPTRAYNLEFRIHNQKDQFVGMGSSAFQGILLDRNTKRIRIEIGPLILTSGQYAISFSAVDSHGNIRYDNWAKCCAFDVIECHPFGFGHEMRENWEGICVIQHSYTPVE